VFASTLKYWPWQSNCSPCDHRSSPPRILDSLWQSKTQSSPDRRGSPRSHCENLPTAPHSEVVPWKGH